MRDQADRIRRAEALWAEVGPAISRTLVSYERDAERRQDLTQEVFLAFLGSIERIEGAGNRKAYLFRIAHNVAVDHVAREAKHRWVELDDATVDPGVDPAGEVDQADERGHLLEAVRKLTLPYRQVIVLALEGLEHEEIAEVLGIEAGTVRVRYFRAKTRLKELLNHAR